MACAALILMVSGTWGSAFGISVGYSWAFTREDVTIRAEGSVDPDNHGTIRQNLVASVQFLEGSPVAVSDTAASLVMVSKTVDGVTKTETLLRQIPRGAGRTFNRESPPSIVTQDFICKGAAAIPVLS